MLSESECSSDDETYDFNTSAMSRLNECKTDLLNFLSDHTELHREKGNKETNIIDQENGKCYFFDESERGRKRTLDKFFIRLEKCRRENVVTMFYEKQNPEKSGIMLDFDFKVDNSDDIVEIDDNDKFRLINHIIHIINNLFDIDGYLKEAKKITVCVTSNPTNYNFHILIPGIQISRMEKRFLINEIIESKIITVIFEKMRLLEMPLDVNCAFVPVILVGSTRYAKNTGLKKKIKPAYKISFLQDFRIDGDIISREPCHMLLSDDAVNLCMELSLNFINSKRAVIMKKKINLRPESRTKYEKFCDRLGRKNDEIKELDEADNMLSILKNADPNIMFVEKLIDILAPYRSIMFLPWLKVTSALASMGNEYKGISLKFNMKYPDKFNKDDWEKRWANLVKEKKFTDGGAIGYLQMIAKIDNPRKYEVLKKYNINSFILKKIHDIKTDGKLEHADVAKILYRICKHKFVVDRAKQERKYTWYEFILDKKNAKPGEVLKWRKIEDGLSGNPLSLEKYITSNLSDVFTKMLAAIKNKKSYRPEGMTEAKSQIWDKYDKKIFHNFRTTCNKLSNDQFVRGIISRCRPYFSVPGFADEMDKDGMVIGVGNGVLELYPDGRVKLVDTFHTHKITKYTKTYYKDMDPSDPMTIYILKLIRNMFPDDRVDSFNWFMHWLGSSLDGMQKELFLLMLYGQGNNGKSLITSLYEDTFGEDYSHSINSTLLTAMSKSAESATPEFVKISGRHFIKFSEVNQTQALNVQTLKRLIGGELVSGRKLYQDTMQFLPIAIFVILLNVLIDIPTAEESTWKRIKLIHLPYSFYATNDIMYDSKNKFHKPADVDAKNKLKQLDAKEAFLSIVIFYWQSLQINYNGRVMDVDHKNIKRDTMNYRNKQDTMSLFINRRLVSSSDKENRQYVNVISMLYIKWYESAYNRSPKSHKSAIEESLKNSKIGKLLKKDDRLGSYLLGYRFLSPTEEPRDDEKYHFKTNNYSENTDEFSDNITESVDETIENIIKMKKSIDEKIEKMSENSALCLEQRESDIKELELKRKHQLKNIKKRKEKKKIKRDLRKNSKKKI